LASHLNIAAAIAPKFLGRTQRGTESRKETHMALTLEQQLAQLKAENEALKAKATGGLSLKVGDKGGIVLAGLGQFPTTLYYDQWVKVLAMGDQIHAFAKANEALIEERKKNPVVRDKPFQAGRAKAIG
jgi:hypothetical protein